MTKKSYARQMRDKAKNELEDNRCWDELNSIYQSAYNLLHQHTMISAFAVRQDLLACLPDPSSTATNINILKSDILNLNQELSEIYAKHKGRTGGSQDPDEVMQSIMISQDYAMFVEKHTGIVQPLAFKILEDFQQAEKILAQRLAQAELENTQIISGELKSKNKLDIVDAEIIENTTQH